MIIPKSLVKGDKVAIVATARKISSEEIQPAIQLLKSWGLEAVTGKTINAEENQFAGSDTLRTEDFQNMLDNPEIKAIWCARGGYGTVRIIDKLDFTTFEKRPKWIIGYSDITVLHNHLHNMDFQTLHAPLAFDIAGQRDEVRNNLRNILFGKSVSYTIPAQDKNRLGSTEGNLCGGNLSVIYSLCGSPLAINTNGKVLFLEDLDEYLYHLDRMLQNLKRNGLFDNLAGLVIGGMSAMRDNTKAFGFAKDNPYGKTAEEIIIEAVSQYDFPMCFGFPAGHTSINKPLLMGSEVTLEVTENQVNLRF